MQKGLSIAFGIALAGAASVACAQSVFLGQPVIIAAPPVQASQPAASQPVEPQAAVVRTGILTLNLSIAIASTIPTTTPIKCQFNPTVFGFDPATATPEYIFEYSQVTATRTSPTAATCSVRVPYSWTINNVLTAKLYPSFQVIATDATGNGRIFGLPQYFTNAGVGVPIPANGANTTFTRNARI